MLIEGAIGDAYGAGFEMQKPDEITPYNTLDPQVRLGSDAPVYLRYTDDTQMAIAISELMLQTAPWTELLIADKFVEVFKRDVRKGYAHRFFDLLVEVNSGAELLRRIYPANSERNGAAMRAYPLGRYADESEIMEKARLQASITHNTAGGIASAQAVALMAHYCLFEKGKLQYLPEYLAEKQGIRWNVNWTAPVPCHGHSTVEAILTVLMQERKLSGLLKASCAFGGDVDTVAAVAAAVGSLSKEVETDLPDWTFEKLENEAFGRDYILGLDEKLCLIR